MKLCSSSPILSHCGGAHFPVAEPEMASVLKVNIIKFCTFSYFGFVVWVDLAFELHLVTRRGGRLTSSDASFMRCFGFFKHRQKH